MDQIRHGDIQSGTDLTRIGGCVPGVAQQFLQRIILWKRWRCGEQEVHRAAERIEVAADINISRVLGLFRRYVIKGTQDYFASGDLVRGTVAVVKTCQSHVDKFYISIWLKDDVRRLDVTVNDIALPGVIQGLGNLRRVEQDVLNREGARPHDPFTQVLAIDIFEDDIVPVLRLPDIVNSSNIGMVEPRGILSFDFETLQGVL